MKISVIIPAFKERRTIKELLRQVRRAQLPSREWEIIVVDDSSIDGTKELLERLSSELGFILVRHGKNRGKGAGIRTALPFATGDLVLI